MAFEIKKILERFHLLGLSHKKTPISVRERFYITNEILENIFRKAQNQGMDSLICMSTCNRTELYGFTDHPRLLRNYLIDFTKGNKKELDEYAYQLNGDNAVRHLFEVSAGLDSQVLGDFQVAGQIKNAYRKAETLMMINPFMNRLFTQVFHSTKKIKNETELSKGAASIAHAAVQFIKDKQHHLDKTHLLLYGLGDVGKVACINLVNYIQNRNLVLINRSKEKAKNLAKRFNITYKGEEDLKDEAAKANIIVVATGSQDFTLLKSHFNGYRNKKLILDLSLPRNVHSDVEKLDGIDVVCIDQLSYMNHKVLEKRKKNIPRAKQIINKEISIFYNWLEINHLSPIFQAVQKGLLQIKENEIAFHKNNMTASEFQKADLIATNLIKKISRLTISHIRKNYKSQISSFETIKEIFKT